MPRRRDLTLIGDRKLAKKFEKLASTAARNRIVRRPLAAALTPISKAAKRNVPVRFGLLKKSIGKKVKAYPGGVWGGVGPRTGFRAVDEDGKTVDPIKYAHLVEFGTSKTSPKPFLRPAFDATRSVAMRILRTGMAKNLIKEALKK